MSLPIQGKTINQLSDIGNTQESTAVVAIEQNGSTFKASVRPNPPRQINVTSQAQLEAELGVNLEIPDSDKITIVVDESFTLTKPFLIGANSVLEIYASTIEGTITYTGTDTMFRPIVAGNTIRALLIHDMFITGNGTQLFCNVTVTSRCFIEQPRVASFKGAFLEGGAVKFDNLAAVNWSGTFIIKNPVSVNISNTNLRNSPSNQVTFLSFIVGINSRIVIDGNPESILSADEALVFFDPNAPPTASFIISGTTISAGDFYQQGSDLSVVFVGDNGNGKMFVTTSTPHLFQNGQVVVLSGFTESTYNGTFKVSNIATNDFDVETVDFVGSDTGNVNASSLNSTDVLVSAQENPGQPNSMAQAEARTNVAGISFTSAIGSFEPFEDDTPAADDFIQDVATERFTVDNQTGIITYNGLEPLSATISYEFTISKDGGGTDTVTASLFKNTTKQDKTDKLRSITSTPQDVTYPGGIFQINPGDTLQLKLDSDAVSIVNISNLTILVSQQ